MRAHLSNGPLQLSGVLAGALGALLLAVPTIRPQDDNFRCLVAVKQP